MNPKVLLIALVGLSACTPRTSLAPSAGPFRFSGTILAADGARIGGPIVGAQLIVVKGVNLSAEVTSDAAGHYAFDRLESGRFTVAITAPGYATANPIVALYKDIDATFALAPQ